MEPRALKHNLLQTQYVFEALIETRGPIFTSNTYQEDTKIFVFLT